MKIKALIVAVGLFLTSVFSSSAQTQMPILPLARFSASPSIVQTGTYPTLSWNIFYPTSIRGVADISASGSCTVLEDLYVSVRPLGVNVTGHYLDTTNQATEMRVSLNGTGYERIFYGYKEDIDASYPTYIKKLSKGDTLDFGGRFVRNGEWTSFYTTKSRSLKVVPLINGDTVKHDDVAAYLKPYVDGGNHARLGPLSFLIVMELAETAENENFDYKDAALLVSFSKMHPNNGHGNNIDGVDVSNPSVGQGGPNGAEDLSGGVDDEK